MEESKLVLEIMHELKNSSKRWFIAGTKKKNR